MEMLLGQGAENRRAVRKGLFAAATQECERAAFRKRRASGDRDIEHFDAVRLAATR
jgi:hypothetical protein